MSIVRYCRRQGIGLIHSYTPRNNILSSIAARFLAIPVIWHERNLLFGNENDISRKFLFLPDRVICNSQAIAQRFRKQGKLPRKVRVVLNGVDLESFKPRKVTRQIREQFQVNGRRVVGLISNLGKRKMPEYLLDICPYVLERSPDTLFVIVGGEFGETDKGRKTELEARAKRLGISDHVIFTGFVSNVSEIIPLFDVGLAVTEKEACSRAILEMMASGKPIVAFDTGGNAELIDHGVTGVLVNFGDTNALASSVVGLLQDDQGRRQMAIRARRRAEDYFDVGINAQRTQEIYSELIGGKLN
ncbi:MAG: glycosyltransferase family 4 protein [Thermodesulfobacteriota bacterium]|nr:glycosyltransferase family 4 protein [Thermodesulfobacteriota bacterium]